MNEEKLLEERPRSVGKRFGLQRSQWMAEARNLAPQFMEDNPSLNFETATARAYASLKGQYNERRVELSKRRSKAPLTTAQCEALQYGRFSRPGRDVVERELAETDDWELTDKLEGTLKRWDEDAYVVTISNGSMLCKNGALLHPLWAEYKWLQGKAPFETIVRVKVRGPNAHKHIHEYPKMVGPNWWSLAPSQILPPSWMTLDQLLAAIRHHAKLRRAPRIEQRYDDFRRLLAGDASYSTQKSVGETVLREARLYAEECDAAWKLSPETYSSPFGQHGRYARWTAPRSKPQLLPEDVLDEHLEEVYSDQHKPPAFRKVAPTREQLEELDNSKLTTDELKLKLETLQQQYDEAE